EAEQSEANEVELDAATLTLLYLLFHIGRIFDDARGEKEREQADGNVEEEDPAPVEAVGDVAAQRWPDGGRDDDGEAVHRKGLAAFFGREGIGEDGLFGRRESA